MNIIRRMAHSGSTSEIPLYDLVVVGGGIVGIASAREIILRHPKMKVAVVEQENKLAYHQSSHNSGIVHTGIFCNAGTLKAQLCVEGFKLIYKYCDEKQIPYKVCGNLIVATDESEVGRLNDLLHQGLANKIPNLQMIEGDQIKEIEPYCHGVKALWSPGTGIVDWLKVTENFARDFQHAGGDILLNFEVTDLIETTENSDYPITVVDWPKKRILTKHVLTCGGLQADKLSQMSGCSKKLRIAPIRGEFLVLNPEMCHMVRGNIYQVPDPKFPFLTVHFTPKMDGSVLLGPFAVLAFKRDRYKGPDNDLLELIDAIRHPGFIQMPSKSNQMIKCPLIPLRFSELQKIIPKINEYDVQEQKGPVCVRAQAMDEFGNFIHEFTMERGQGIGALSKRVLNCRNATSPGASSSMAIAKLIADELEKDFKR